MTIFEYFLVPGNMLTNESTWNLLTEHGVTPETSRTNIMLGKRGLQPAYRVSLEEMVSMADSRGSDQWIRSLFYRRQPAGPGKDPGPITAVPRKTFEDTRNQPQVRQQKRNLRAAIEAKVRRELSKPK